jgi:hypothetical protein
MAFEQQRRFCCQQHSSARRCVNVEAQSSMAGDCATIVQWLKAINKFDISITVGNEIKIIAETVAKSGCDQSNMVTNLSRGQG